MVVHHDESLDHGGFFVSRRTSSEEFAEYCAPTESWESLAEGTRRESRYSRAGR